MTKFFSRIEAFLVRCPRPRTSRRLVEGADGDWSSDVGDEEGDVGEEVGVDWSGGILGVVELIVVGTVGEVLAGVVDDISFKAPNQML